MNITSFFLLFWLLPLSLVAQSFPAPPTRSQINNAMMNQHNQMMNQQHMMMQMMQRIETYEERLESESSKRNTIENKILSLENELSNAKINSEKTNDSKEKKKLEEKMVLTFDLTITPVFYLTKMEK